MAPLSSDSLARVMDVVRTVARTLIAADGVTFVVREGNSVRYVEEDAIGPLWKGQLFPISQCVSGWVITHGAPAVIPDVYTDDRVPVAAYQRTFVKSMVMVPIGAPPVAAIGAYWATPHEATRNEIDTLIAIADSALLQTED